MANQPELDEIWAGGEGVNANGVAVMMRYRPNLQAFIGSGLYQTRMDMEWRYDDIGDAFMPSSGEMTLIENFEQALLDAFAGDHQSLLAFVYTGGGVRRWVWYTKNSQEAAERISPVAAGFDEADLTYTRTEDANWQAYFDLIDLYGRMTV